MKRPIITWSRPGSQFGCSRSKNFDRSQVLLDPCTGFGRIAEAAKVAGYTVIAADIIDQGYPGCLVQDFLDRKPTPPTVVGNPPFNAVEAFASHALELGARKVALLFPVARLNAARWLKELPLRRIWLLTPRPSIPPGYVIARGEKPGGGKTDFTWLIFERDTPARQRSTGCIATETSDDKVLCVTSGVLDEQ